MCHGPQSEARRVEYATGPIGDMESCEKIKGADGVSLAFNLPYAHSTITLARDPLVLNFICSKVAVDAG